MIELVHGVRPRAPCSWAHQEVRPAQYRNIGASMNTDHDAYLKYIIFLHAVEGAELNKDLHRAHTDHLRRLDASGTFEYCCRENNYRGPE